jgi:hypothetical protein
MEADRLHPAIVVAAWNRPRSLLRLLSFLSRGHYPEATTLHISIDHFPYDDVVRLAEEFVWPFGAKVVEVHPQRLGLRDHILHCGGLTARYGAVVLLEDDLIVSPLFYDFAVQALGFFGAAAEIGSIGLYSPQVAESCHQPFQPWMDGFDNWFLQVPSSWGAVYTAAQWTDFEAWLRANAGKLPLLPTYIHNWSAQSWKKLFAAYLIDTGKYTAYPHVALASNCEDIGAGSNASGVLRVPLLMGEKAYRFVGWEASNAVYDAHYEFLPDRLKRIVPSLGDVDFCVDLLGQKERIWRDRPWVLTRLKAGGAGADPAAVALPSDFYVALGLQGGRIGFARAEDKNRTPDAEALEFEAYSGVAKVPLLHLPLVRWPSMAVIVPCVGDADAVRRTLDSALAQDYLGLDVVLICKAGAMPAVLWEIVRQGRVRLVEAEADGFGALHQAVMSRSWNLVQILEPGAELRPGVVRTVAQIFMQFQGLDWISGLGQSLEGKALSMEIALRRWDGTRFQAADAETLRAALPTSLQVFQQSLWANHAEGTTNLDAQWKKMASQQLPRVAALHLANLAENWTIPQGKGIGRVNQTRKYYHRHVPLLWKMHRRLSDYAPVLRYDAVHDTWFEFDY